MTKFHKYIMLAAAAVTLSGAASAQTLKADIPFAFQAGDKVMQPGSYLVTRYSTAGIPTFRFTNLDDRQSAVSMPYGTHDADKAWRADGKARLAFVCGASQCSISDLWDGDINKPASGFPTPKARKESMRTAVIFAEPVRAD